MKITEVHKCRLCGAGGLSEVFDFGMTSLPTWPKTSSGGSKTPLKFMACPSCFLGQLAHSINQESLFREYWYRTGINQTMRSHMAVLAKAVSKEIGLSNKDTIVDIGANDGTLLNCYKAGQLIGFEPSGLCPNESESDRLWINNFFDSSLLPKQDMGNVKALTSTAMFYYLDDPVGFASMIKDTLAVDGVWVCEMNYALDMMQRNSFDHISHEHVTCWSAGQFNQVIKKCGMELFRIERNDLNGGSIRFWASRPGVKSIEPSVKATIEAEKGQFDLKNWHKFAHNIRRSSADLKRIVSELKDKDKYVMVYGSSTRGITILAAANLDAKTIDAAVERNPEKFGRYYGATGIPVISEDDMRSDPPDALLILPYSFITEFLSREKDYLKKGGVFIVPLPEPKILSEQVEVIA